VIDSLEGVFGNDQILQLEFGILAGVFGHNLELQLAKVDILEGEFEHDQE